jgi:hypothetical protein|tara:strand:- start:1824 stop:6194 length:4371 start_codon:yes stop_codon:yes gene_type:complete
MANIKLRISPGKAYVNGYKIQKNLPTFLSVSKATETATITNDTIGASYGHFVYITADTSSSDVNVKHLPNISDLGLVQIRNATAYGGTSVGSCRVRAMEKYDSVKDSAGVALVSHKLYIFDIQMYAGQFFSTGAKSIGTSDQNYVNIYQENLRSVVHSANNKGLIFSAAHPRIKSVVNLSMFQQKKYTVSRSANTTSITFSSASGEIFSNTNDWIITNHNGLIETPTITLNGSFNTVTISGLSVGSTVNATNVEVIGYIYKSNAVLAQKTRQNGTRNYTVPWTPGVKDAFVDLNELDIISVTAVRYADVNGDDITDKFILDNGQRDSFYETGKLRLKNGQSLDDTTIWVAFTHFEHGPGDYFAPNSYVGAGFGYNEINTYTMEDGSEVDLKDVIDLRPSKGQTGNDFTHSSARVSPVPKPISIITADIEYYLPRYDKLVVQQSGEFKYIEGVASMDPKFPDAPTSSMEIYRIRLNPFTLDSTDLSFSLIENKRYTMRDIGKIDKRIDDLEEAVSLSLLEMDTKNIQVFDENGNPRTKSGFTADNFSDQTHTDIYSTEYRASIDPQEQFTRPKFNPNNIGLVYDHTQSTGTVLVGDNIFLNYTNQDYLEQNLASGAENVNPFMISSFRGHVKMSPSSDDWKEIGYMGANIIDNGTRLNTDAAILWNEWEWNWGGSDLNGLEVGNEISQTGVTNEDPYSNVTEWRVRSGWLKTGKRYYRRTITGVNRTTSTVVNRIVGSETINEVVGDRFIQWSFIPYMRSKMVFFKASGLQPNTEMFAFFDDRPVTDWVKQESFSSYNTHKQTEYGNSQVNATGHPSGNTKLYSDNNGQLEGSFFIPSTDNIRFKTGALEFKLTDITKIDDDKAISIASGIFNSTGILDTHQEDIETTRVLEVVGTTEETSQRRIQLSDSGAVRIPHCVIDPLAQSFTVSESTGVYITNVTLYFKQKSSTMPVWIQIRPMVNGYPSSDVIVPGSQKLLTSPQVSISSDGTVGTIFVFDEPIRLKGGSDYALVCLTDNTDYLLYTSKVGEFVLGTTEEKINRQPFLGSLFKSQNSKTWEAAQWEDMKFKIQRAKFTETSGTVFLKNATVPTRVLGVDPITLFGKDSPTLVASKTTVKVSAPNHGLLIGDSVVISGVVNSTYGNAINNGGTAHTITEIDPYGFAFVSSDGFITGAAATASVGGPLSPVITGGSNVTITPQYAYNLSWPNIDGITPIGTTINFTHKGISGKSYAGNESPYVQYGAESVITKTNNYYEYPRVISNAIRESQLGYSSLQFYGNMTTVSDFVSPVIDIQRASVTLVENIIDNPVSVDSSAQGNNVLFDVTTTGYDTYNPETDPLDGSSAAKHITKSVRLLSPANGLKVFMGINKPSVCNVDLYYKAEMGEIDFESVNWTLAELDTAMPSDDDASTFREYIYTIGGDIGTLPDFTKFKLKIVMQSTNSSRVPAIRDLRAISLGD